MSYYTDKQYKNELSENAKKDLNLLFFQGFLKEAENILDIGCSKGRILELDSKRITGIDIDKKAIEIAKKNKLNVKYVDIAKGLPFQDNSFEGVFCSQVIEHLENPLFLFKEIKRILKKNGKAVIITQDYIMTSRKYEDGFWSDYTHKQPFIPNSLKEISYDSGFRKFRVYHFPGKGFRNLIRSKIISKETWIKLEKIPFIWKGQDLILELIKD